MPAGAFHPLFTPACFLVAVARVVGESPGTVSEPPDPMLLLALLAAALCLQKPIAQPR